MPRKKKQTKRRSGNSAISISQVAEGLMIANAGSQMAFKSSAWEFLTAGTNLNPNTAWTGQGSTTLSLKEIMNWSPARVSGSYAGMSAGQVIMSNVKENALNFGFQALLIPVGFKLGRRLLRRPISMGNKLLKQAGLRSVVRI